MPATILSDNGASSGTAGLKTSGSNDGILELQTTTAGGTATAAITIDTAQRSKFPTTIGVGGATPAASGAGITFPATASASSDANTLDDYEEGTWTPVIGGSSSDPTVGYQSQAGSYRKIGGLVMAQFFVATSSYSGGSGELQLHGLPFTTSSTSGSSCEFSVRATGFASNNSLLGTTRENATKAEFYYKSSITGNTANNQVSDVDGSSTIQGVIIYHV